MTDDDVRVELYRQFVATASAPTAADVAGALGADESSVADVFRRLEQARVIVLAPGTTNVWMANPLSAVPTAFPVETPSGSFWGNCIWDGLGVVAMLGGTGTVSTWCADCQEPMTMAVQDGRLADGDGLAHFAVPARNWWDNIGFT